MANLRKDDILFPEVSYQIVGAAFEVFNRLGWGHKEIIYQKAFSEELRQRKISHEREKIVEFRYKNTTLGKQILDFMINKEVVVELKIKPRLGYTHIKQVMEYLKLTNCKLAILLYFTPDGVKYRRILNS